MDTHGEEFNSWDRTLDLYRALSNKRTKCKRNSLKDFTHLRRAGDFSDAIIHVGHVSFPVHRNILACCSPYFRALFLSGQESGPRGPSTSRSKLASPCSSGAASQSTSSFATLSSPSFDDGGELMGTHSMEHFGSTCQELIGYTGMASSTLKEDRHTRTNSSKTRSSGSPSSQRRGELRASTPQSSLIPFTGRDDSATNSTNSCYEVNITDISPEVMNDLIEHAYGGEVQVSAHNVERLLPAADRFQVTTLLQECCDFLLSEMSISNCISIVKFANHFFQCEALRLKGTQYLLDNFTEVFQTSPDFGKLTCEELTSIIRADRLNVRKEELVLDAIIRWVMADVENRQHHIQELVSCARVGLMVPRNMKDFMDSWLTSSNYNSLFNKVSFQVMECILELQKQQMVSVDSAMFSARLPHDVLFVVGGSNFGYPLNLLEAFDCRTHYWATISPYDFAPRSYHGVVAVDQEIYVIGGFSGQTYLSSCCKLIPATLTWEDVTPMNTKRCYVGTAFLQGNIYAVGGFDGVYRLNSAERHDRDSNQWSFVSPMLQQRSDAGVAVLNDKLYVCGGFNGTEVLRAMEVYDPSSGLWTPGCSMSRGRSGLGLAAHLGKLYAVGGFDGTDSSVRLSTMESFDPLTEQWTMLEPMPHARSNLAVEILEDVLYAIGGFNGNRTTCVVECYNFDTNTWYQSTKLSHNRSALCACVIRGLTNTGEILRPDRASAHPLAFGLYQDLAIGGAQAGSSSMATLDAGTLQNILHERFRPTGINKAF